MKFKKLYINEIILGFKMPNDKINKATVFQTVILGLSLKENKTKFENSQFFFLARYSACGL